MGRAESDEEIDERRQGDDKLTVSSDVQQSALLKDEKRVRFKYTENRIR